MMRVTIHEFRLGIGLWLLGLALDILPAPQRNVLVLAIKSFVQDQVMCNGDYTNEGLESCPVHGKGIQS